MKSKYKVFGFGAVIVLLFVFSVPQVRAQTSLTLRGLSGRIDSLSRRVIALEDRRASKVELLALAQRVATLEAEHGQTAPVATFTRLRPTATRTRVRPTATSVSIVPFVTIGRKMNVRQGPGTHFPIIGVAEPKEVFDITGKGAAGNWWRIDYEGQNAWIYAPYVIATNATGIRVVPTPTSQPVPTATPVPTAKADQWRPYDYAYALTLWDRQRSDLRREWKALSTQRQHLLVNTVLELLILTAEHCNMTIPDATEMVNTYGQQLDDVGYTTRNDIRARAVLMLVLTGTENVERSRTGCDAWLARGVRRLVAGE